MAAAEGKGFVNGVQRVAPPLQPEKGKFDERILNGLDILLTELDKRKMKAVLFLSNNWEWTGGFLQYLRWNGLIEDSVFRRKLNWDEMRDYVSRFYSCDDCKKDYLKQVAYILGHTNKISGKKYINEPAIMAWELANEPRPMRPAANEDYKKWNSDVAAFIKAKDKNHLVTLGTEGEMGTESMELFEQVHADKNVDYLTMHIWPKNWGWFKPATMEADFSQVLSRTGSYISRHLAAARKIKKPLVIEEFGLPRDGHIYEPSATTALRDRYYAAVFSSWEQSVQNNGAIAGANFWTYNGVVYPKTGEISWKEGDDYRGDPPMEEQGLNGVFNSDSSTWTVISSALQVLNRKTFLPADTNAAVQTRTLYKNLNTLRNTGFLFGHQDDLAYGVGWKYQPGRSDVKEVTGDYPAVYGWELGRLEMDAAVNLDSVPFKKMQQFIKDGYKRGGLITISWHLNNPLTGKSAWEPAEGTVASILPGGSKNELYRSWLDKVAAFMNQLKDENGKMIPVLFRPFHELNGNWFWWGGSHCTAEEFKSLWQFTVSYLRDEKKLHHLLYVYNTDQFSSKEAFLEKYPGNEWVDIIGFDIYQRNTPKEQYVSNLDNMLTMLEDIAAENNKVPALTEFGGNMDDSTWWTGTFLPVVSRHNIAYVLGWRNAGIKPNNEVEFYVPYKGQKTAGDFKTFYKAKRTLFQKDIANWRLYR